MTRDPHTNPDTGFGFRHRSKGNTMSAAKKIAFFAALLALILLIINRVRNEVVIGFDEE